MKTIDIKNTDGEVVHSFTSKNNSFSKTLKNYMQKKLQENNTSTPRQLGYKIATQSHQ